MITERRIVTTINGRRFETVFLESCFGQKLTSRCANKNVVIRIVNGVENLRLNRIEERELLLQISDMKELLKYDSHCCYYR